MSIEPLSSIMSLQAQGSAVNKKVSQTENVKSETDISAVSEVSKVDKIISVIEESQNKNNTDDQKKQQDNDRAQNEKIRKAVEQLNKNMYQSEAVFGIHEETNRITIKIVDKQTKELIKELPPEKTLDMISKVWEMAGILVDEKR